MNTEESKEEPDWINLFWQQRKSNLKPLPTFHPETQMNNSTKCTLTDQELAEKVDKWVTDLTHSGGDKWSLRVPADHNHDPDFLFVEAARRMNRYASRISELEAENKRLREEHRWIPVTERLPETSMWVLCICSEERHWLAFRALNGWYIDTSFGQKFVGDQDETKHIKIQHWQPLTFPQPPKEQ